MAEVAAESWWIKLGVMFDKSGFKTAIIGMSDLKSMAQGLADTFKKVVDANTDLYYTSHALNMSTKDLQIWERTFQFVGGTVDEARQNINNLNYAYEELILGMSGAKAEAAARLHLLPEDLLSMESAMSALNRVYNDPNYFNRNRGFFTPLARQLGLSNSAIELVTLSVDEYQAKLKKASSIPLIPENQIKAARELKEQFTQLTLQWENFKSALISTSLPAISTLFKDIESVMTNKEFQKGLSQFFIELEKGFSSFINDVDHKQLIEDLKVISEATLEILKVTAKGTSAAIKTGTQFIKDSDYVVGNTQTGGITVNDVASTLGIKKGYVRMANLGLKSTMMINPGYAAASIVNKYMGNISINILGSTNAEETANAVEERLRAVQSMEDTASH